MTENKIVSDNLKAASAALVLICNRDLCPRAVSEFERFDGGAWGLILRKGREGF